MTYYLSVSEVLAQTPDNRNQTLRIGGSVSPGIRGVGSQEFEVTVCHSG